MTRAPQRRASIDRLAHGRHRQLERHEHRICPLDSGLRSANVLRPDSYLVIDVPDDRRFTIVADETQADRGRSVRARLDPLDVHPLPAQRGNDIAPEPVLPHHPDRGHLSAEPR